MSSLISAFFIEPVRRRLSNATGPRRDVPPAQSHVNDQASPAITEQKARRQQQLAITEGQSGGNLGLTVFDRFAPLRPERPVVADATARPSTRPPESLSQHVCLNSTSSEDASVNDASTDAMPVTAMGNAATTLDDDMPLASPFDIAEPSVLVPSASLSSSSSTSPRLSRNATMRTTARDIPRPDLAPRMDIPSVSTSLPADDGMRLLRARIHEIRELPESPEDKARRMHDLMTAEWKAAQVSCRPTTPASMTSQDRPFLPSSPFSSSARAVSPLSTSSLPLDPQNPYNLEPEDLQPSYRPIVASDSPTDGNNTEEDLTPPVPEMGCKHYKRNVKIQCYDCKRWYPCRHCHDADQPSHHLNRRATENMLCMLCFTPQAAGQWCKECGERGAWYYCDICKLWDDDGSKSIYHCSDCGICRRGEGIGKDFVHCKVYSTPIFYQSP
jgi:hypothetical protein